MNIAIITGASSGMGKEFVIQGDKRYNLDEIWVIARRKERLEELVPLCSAKVVPICLDLLNSESFNFLAKKYKTKVADGMSLLYLLFCAIKYEGVYMCNALMFKIFYLIYSIKIKESSPVSKVIKNTILNIWRVWNKFS